MLYTVTNGGLQNGRPTAIGSVSIALDFSGTHVFTIANFTTETSPEYSDPEGDPLAYIKILSLPTTGVLSVEGIVSQVVTVGSIIQAGTISSGNFIYTSVGGDYTSTWNFDAADTGSSSLSGLDAGTVAMAVAKTVNGKPDAVGDNTISKNYSESHVFTLADFTTNTTPPYSDPEGDLPQAVKILTLPSAGVIQFNGSDVIVNQTIKANEIDLGYLVYTPNLGTTTAQTLTFNFSVSDAGSGEFTE
jgi:hypothetical protein